MNTRFLSLHSFKSTLMSYLLMFLLLSGCTAGYSPAYTSPPVEVMAGQLVEAHSGAIARLVLDGAKGLASVKIFSSCNGDCLLFARPYPELRQWLFWGIRTSSMTQLQYAGQIVEGGQYAGTEDFSSLVTALQGVGWKAVGASAIPKALIEAASRVSGFAQQLGNFRPTFIFCPAVIFPDGHYEWLVDPLDVIPEGDHIDG